MYVEMKKSLIREKMNRCENGLPFFLTKLKLKNLKKKFNKYVTKVT